MTLALAPAQTPVRERVRVRVRGAVQGVGFRPYVYGLAARYGVVGWVLNDGQGVLLEAEGIAVQAFLEALPQQLPPLARVDAVEITKIPVIGGQGFGIRNSKSGVVMTDIPADACVCEACLEELFDPADRHYRYPFLNCTHCGPRYTITRRLPYDRPATSMATFTMCPDCASDYADPMDRRFHAQPIACPTCGPQLSMEIEDIISRIQDGEILAIKGLGGFHLMCDARNERAVSELRKRKRREEKPFAVMVANVRSAEDFAHIDEDEASQLKSTARPVVVLDRAGDRVLAPSVAPGLDSVGVMLPYTPLQYLLFHEAAGRPDGTTLLADAHPLVLVMTSANPGGEPLVTDNDEADMRLGDIADTIITHNRDIVVRADDSVVRMIGGQTTFVRRARGFAPQAVKLGRILPPGLAVGAHLKNTICVTRGDEAFVSQHIGDLDTPDALTFFQETVDHLLAITQVTPTWVAHDLHPDFHSTRFAIDYATTHGIAAYGVQHHHAHVACVIAEHGLDGPVLGLALDGFGLGESEAEDVSLSWGGEALLVEDGAYQRVGHLAPLAMPGGEFAFRAPWRIAGAVLHQQGRLDAIRSRFAGQGDIDMFLQTLDKNINVHPSTSCGRLFDAAAGLLGVLPTASYDGQAPMKLESLVTEPLVLNGTWQVSGGVLNLHGLLHAISDMEPVQGANAFHGTLIAAMAEWTQGLVRELGVRRVALSGGCILNRTLTQGLERALRAQGVEVYRPLAMPPGDGGLCLGQAYTAGLRAVQME